MYGSGAEDGSGEEVELGQDVKETDKASLAEGQTALGSRRSEESCAGKEIGRGETLRVHDN